MGLDTGGSSNRKYLSISDGRIAIKADASEPGVVKKMSKDGTREWFEKQYPSVTGFIVSVFKRTSDQGYGDQLCIVLQDGSDQFQVQMPWSSRYSSGFFLTMPNIDLSKPVTLSPWAKEIDGKKKTMLYVRQGQENVEWAWTREDPKGMPELKQIKVKGQLVWDDSERQEFFEAYLKDQFLPYLQTYHAENAPASVPAAGRPATTSGDPDDDLPF